MTDLERVRESLKRVLDPVHGDLIKNIEAALVTIDAHLKEDAERDTDILALREVKHQSWLRVEQAEAELAELREAVKAYFGLAEHTYTTSAEKRVLQLIEETEKVP